MSSFYIGTDEVSQLLWVSVMGENPSSQQNAGRPVESISYEDILEFIEKLNKLTGESYRLPTNAEWEYAARGGAHSPGFWDDTIGNHSVLASSLPNPNELGIYNMTSGVAEWVSDKYSKNYYKRVNPRGPLVTFWRTKYCYRGGYWDEELTLYLLKHTFSASEEDAYEWLGFRLAKSTSKR